jgi:hypothetical protein
MRAQWDYILALIMLALVLPELAHACSCSGPGPVRCNLLLKESSAIFVGRVVEVENQPNPNPKLGDTGQSRYIFAVSESFAGMSGGEAIVYSGRGGADCSYHFKKGEQYLVYAYKGSDQILHATTCSRTQPAAGAEILLRQLRAAKEHKPVASLYGVLQRAQQPYEGTWNGDYDRPVTNTKIRLRSKSGKVFTTKTDGSGAYAFYNLPEGIYQVSADLPQDLGIAQTILSDPPSPIDLPAQSCYEYDIEAMPRARIVGHLVAPDGTFIEGAVELFAQETYAPERQENGWWEYAKGEKGFQFLHVVPGNYILVFNNSEKPDADAPYPRTFYPGVTDFARAVPVHVAEIDREINADIHLSSGEETNEITVQLEWPGLYKSKKEDVLFLFFHSDSGDHPIARDSGDHAFSARILKRATYLVKGVAFCASRQQVETPSITIHGSDIFTEPLILRFPENACLH